MILEYMYRSPRTPFKKMPPLPQTKRLTGPQLAQLHGWDWMNTESAARRVFELMADRLMQLRDKVPTNKQIENALSGMLNHSEEFKKELKQAIESGKSTDWAYDGENEYEYETYDVDNALDSVLSVLKDLWVKEIKRLSNESHKRKTTT